MLDVFAVDMQALRLSVGTVGAADVRTFVPRQAHPVQRAQDVLFVAPFGTGLIGILDANNAAPTVYAGEDDVEKPDVGGSDVRRAGGAGRDANAHL